MVVLPEPVGPVTKIKPRGRFRSCTTFSGKPISSNVRNLVDVDTFKIEHEPVKNREGHYEYPPKTKLNALQRHVTMVYPQYEARTVNMDNMKKIGKSNEISFIQKKGTNPTLNLFSLFYFSLLFRIIVIIFNQILYRL